MAILPSNRFTPWRPKLVFYNSATAHLYKPNGLYEDFIQDPRKQGEWFCTDLNVDLPLMQEQKEVVQQISAMMRNSLPKQIKGLPNG